MINAERRPKYIFLDLETTGLEAGIDEITEAAWVTSDGREQHFFVRHDRLPSEWVLKNTDYLQRIALAPKVSVSAMLMHLTLACGTDTDTYLVGACPAFDDRFLRHELRRIGKPTPYNYHVIDVEAMAMGALGHARPCTLKDLRAALGIEGENPAAHTALSDAREVRLIFEVLRASYSVGDL